MKISKKITACALVAALSLALGASSAAAPAEIEEPVAEEPAEMAYDVIIEPDYPVVTPGYVVSTPSTAVKDDANLDEKLAEVTLSVRNTLGIGDEYTSFNGNFSDNVTSRMWYLNWSNEDNNINVTAAEDGTVVNYNKYYHRNGSNRYGSNNRFYNPRFQKTTREDAKEAVKRFMHRVLNEAESYVLNDRDYDILSPLGSSSYYFNATLTVNGLETPIYMNITVESDTLEVTRFSRNDFNDSYFGTYPSASPIYAKANAFKALSGKFESTLKYYIVYDENDTEHLHPKAQLQYRFSPTGDWYFDALTGDTVDRNKLYDSVYRTNNINTSKTGFGVDEQFAEAPAAEEEGSYTLTQVELDNIEKIKDVMPPEKIALAIVGKYPELGLQYFEIASSNYSRNTETDEVTASLYFSKRVEKGAEIGMSEKAFKESTTNGRQVYYIRKYVTANGKTGELTDYSTSMPYVREKDYDGKTRTADTLAIGSEFLKKNYPEEFASSALTSTYTNDNNTYANYHFTNTVNGYPLDSNYLYVEVNAIDGTINSFHKWWTDGVEFESADGIISQEKALEIYTSEYTPKLGYITVPVAIDDKAPEFLPYINAGWGGGYVYAFKTAYVLASEGRTYAVAAKNGELLKYDYAEPEGYPVYTDIDQCKNPDKINKLATYGITFGGKEFEPGKLVTQREMIIFLISSMGGRYDIYNENDDYTDMIYNQAAYYGFINENEKSPDLIMRKEDVAEAIIRATEYGAAAKLGGLYKATYNDAIDISEGLAPYLLIADEIGLIEADDENNIHPQAPISREDLAMIVYAFMDR
jgi:hypothetical protein